MHDGDGVRKWTHEQISHPLKSHHAGGQGKWVAGALSRPPLRNAYDSSGSRGEGTQARIPRGGRVHVGRWAPSNDACGPGDLPKFLFPAVLARHFPLPSFRT